MRKKLVRRLLRKVKRVLGEQRMQCRTSWGVRGTGKILLGGFTEFGPLFLQFLVYYAKWSVKNLFRSSEAMRKERISQYKQRERQRNQNSDDVEEIQF